MKTSRKWIGIDAVKSNRNLTFRPCKDAVLHRFAIGVRFLSFWPGIEYPLFQDLE